MILNIQLYKKRLDCLSFSPSSNKWINATHIPLTTRENKIRNAKDEIIADIHKLEEELPENCEQNKDYVFPFDDAYIKQIAEISRLKKSSLNMRIIQKQNRLKLMRKT